MLLPRHDTRRYTNRFEPIETRDAPDPIF